MTTADTLRSSNGLPSHTSDTRQRSGMNNDRGLSRLSDDRLLSRLDELAARERRITLCIIDHLVEVERRDLHLKQGYGSMFSYCTGRLGYSASAANRRIRTARCVRRFPPVREALENHRVNLSTVSMVAGIMTEENHAGLLARVAGCAQDEVKAVVADYRPRGAVRDSVTPVSVRSQPAETDRPVENRTLGCEYSRSGGKISATACPERSGEDFAAKAAVPMTPRDQPVAEDQPTSSSAGAGSSTSQSTDHANEPDDALERQFIVRFAAGPELMRQIEAARSLLSFRLSAGATMSQVLGAVLDEFIERNDPARRNARRVAVRTGRRVKRANGEESKENRRRTSEAGTKARENPRAIPTAVRDAVLTQSHGRCQFVSPAGRRCGATTHLQIDHIVPVALGGTAERANLRVLCARHNRIEAKRLLGDNAGIRRSARS